MGMMDDDAEKASAYTFASSDISDFESELKIGKQQQSISIDDELDEAFLQDDEPGDDQPLEKIKARSSVANATGALFASMLDAAASTAIATFIAKDDPANWKATEDQRSELEEAISEYVKLKGGDIPPGVAVLIIVLSIYGPKVAHAFQFRKFEAKQREMENYISELESRLSKKNTIDSDQDQE